MLLKRRWHAHAHAVVSCWCNRRLGGKEPYHLTVKSSQFQMRLPWSYSGKRGHRGSGIIISRKKCVMDKRCTVSSEEEELRTYMSGAWDTSTPVVFSADSKTRFLEGLTEGVQIIARRCQADPWWPAPSP